MSSDHLEDPVETDGPAQTPLHRREHPDGWQWKLVWIVIACVVLVLLALIVLALYGADRNDKANASEQTLGDLASQVQAKCAANPVDARKVFGDVCGKAKEIDDRPAGAKGDPGAKGDRGDPGPRGIQGAQGPVGPQGPAGPAGPPGLTGRPGPIGVTGQSPQCLLEPTRCVGPSGAAGERGETGPTGPQGEPGATGPQGPQGETGAPGSPGADGANGRDGADGKDGRGIADTDCQDDGTWLVTYTDGTTDTARGPCRVVVAPPEPTDPPSAAKKK